MIKLTKKVVTGAPYYKLTLVADGNDADYVTSTEHFSESEFKEYSYYIYKLMQLTGKRRALREERSDLFTDYIFNHISMPFYSDDICHTLTEATLEYFYEDVVYDVQFNKCPDLPRPVMNELLARIQGGNDALCIICDSLGVDEDELSMSDLEKIDDNYIHCPGCGWWVEAYEMVDEDGCRDCHDIAYGEDEEE